MFKENDFVVYKKDVCQIRKIYEKYVNDIDYYIMNPIDDISLKISVPIDNKEIRPLISKNKINDIINSIPYIETLNCDEKLIENEYKKLLSLDSYENLIKIIETTYLRNKKRIDNQKKTSDKDCYYFEKAERYLYNEFSIVLGKTYEETKNYVVNKVNEII